jgi:hypothetical protein
LRDALRKGARIEAANRTGVVVDLRDAEVSAARDPQRGVRSPVRAGAGTDRFVRSRHQPGETPRLWIDGVAHVVMGRDKRIYRFVQHARFGRIVLAESHEAHAIVDAATDYVARRMVEPEHAFAVLPAPVPVKVEKRGRSVFFTFALGAAALFALALFAALRSL